MWVKQRVKCIYNICRGWYFVLVTHIKEMRSVVSNHSGGIQNHLPESHFTNIKKENLCRVLRSGQWHEVQNFIFPEIMSHFQVLHFWKEFDLPKNRQIGLWKTAFFCGGESAQNSFKKAQSIIFRSVLFAELLYHLRCIKALANNVINYQPQLVQDVTSKKKNHRNKKQQNMNCYPLVN